MNISSVWTYLADHRDGAVIAGLSAALVLVLLGLIVTVRRRGRKTTDGGQTEKRRLDRWVDGVAVALVLLFSAEGMWEVATDTLKLPWELAAGLFVVFESAMVASALRAQRHVDKHGHPGKHAAGVWGIAVVAGFIVATSANTLTEFILRAILPPLAACLWWLGLTFDQEEKPTSRLRWTPRRLGEWIGMLEPAAEDRDLNKVLRDRKVKAMTVTAHRLHSSKRFRGVREARLRRLTLTADDEMVAEVAERVARVHRVVEMTKPAGPVPAGVPAQVPGHMPAQVPAQTGEHVPAQVSGEQGAQTNGHVPDLSAQVPAVVLPARTVRTDEQVLGVHGEALRALLAEGKLNRYRVEKVCGVASRQAERIVAAVSAG